MSHALSPVTPSRSVPRSCVSVDLAFDWARVQRRRVREQPSEDPQTADGVRRDATEAFAWSYVREPADRAGSLVRPAKKGHNRTAALGAAALVATASADTVPSEEPRPRRAPAISLPLALALVYALVVAGLITLRAAVDELDFLGMGWIMLLALVPILPWLIPAPAPALGRAARSSRTSRCRASWRSLCRRPLARSAASVRSRMC